MVIRYANERARAVVILNMHSADPEEVEALLELVSDIKPKDGGVSWVELRPQTFAEVRGLALCWHSAIETGQTPNPILLRWVSRVLSELDHTKSKAKSRILEVLCLKKTGRGRPKAEEKHISIARDVYRLMESGLTLEQSAFQVAEERGIHESTAIRAYSRNKEICEPFPPED